MAIIRLRQQRTIGPLGRCSPITRPYDRVREIYAHVASLGKYQQNLSWLRVFRSAEASRTRPGVGQPLHTSAVRSEKCRRFRGRAWVRMRVIAMFFGPCAPRALTSDLSVLSYNFKRLERFTKLATSSLQNFSYKTAFAGDGPRARSVTEPSVFCRSIHTEKPSERMWLSVIAV